MDFSKYQKIKSDEKMTYLKHPQGHEIKIAHQALNPKMREQLMKLPMAMAEGGLTEDPQVQEKSNQPIVNVNLGPAPMAQPQVQPFDVSSIQPNLTPTVQELAALPNARPNDFQRRLNEIKMLNPGLDPQMQEDQALRDTGFLQEKQKKDEAWKKTDEQAKLARQQERIQKKSELGVALTPEEQSIVQSIPKNMDSPEARYQAALAELQKPDAQQSQGPSLTQSALSGFEKGIRDEAKVLGQLGQEQAAFRQKAEEEAQMKLQKIEQEEVEIKQGLQDLQLDIQEGKIDPQRYINKMNGGQRMLTAVGLFLGGLGGGLLGKENAALGFLNQQIDRDINAQEAELGKKQSLLDLNLKKLGNLRDAKELTRIQTKEMIASQMEMSLAKIQDPLKKAQAEQAIGKYRMENAAVLNTMMQTRKDNVLAEISRLPKQFQDAATKELGEVKGLQATIKEANRVMDDLANLSLADRYAPGSNRVQTLEASLTKIAKTLLGEAFNEGDFQRLVKPFSSGVFTSEAQKAAAKKELISALSSQLPGRAPILTESGILPQAQQFNFKPRGQ